MVNSFQKIPLSASVDGKSILIVGGTSASATPIHTATNDPSAIDEVWLYAYNEATTSLNCSVLWGGVAEPGNVDRTSITTRAGRILIEDGRLIRNGLTISAYVTGSGAYITIDGFVNRITTI